MEVQAAKDKFTPAVAKMASFRDKTHVTRESDHTKRILRAQQQRDQSQAEVDQWQAQHLSDIESRASHDIATAKQRHQDETDQSNRLYAQATHDLETRWKDGLARIQAPIDHQSKDGSAAIATGTIRAGKTGGPSPNLRQSFNLVISKSI